MNARRAGSSLVVVTAFLSVMTAVWFVARGEPGFDKEPQVARADLGGVGDDPAAARAKGGVVASDDAGEGDVREFILSFKNQIVYGTVSAPDGWHARAWRERVLLRNIPIEEISHGGGAAEVRIESPDYPTSGGVELDEMLSSGVVNVGGNEVAQTRWIAPPEGDETGERTRAIVVDGEGRILVQVVTAIQAMTSIEDKLLIEAAFKDILASLETHSLPSSREWDSHEIRSATWQMKASLPDGWTIGARGEEVFEIRGTGVSGDEIGLVLERVDANAPALVTALDVAYRLGDTLMDRRALRVPGPEYHYLIVRGAEERWSLQFDAAYTDDRLMLHSIVQSCTLVPIGVPAPPQRGAYPRP